MDQVRLIQPPQAKLDGIGSIFQGRNNQDVRTLNNGITVEIENSGDQIGYIQQPDGQIVMVNLGNTVATNHSPVKQAATGQKLININEQGSTIIQQQDRFKIIFSFIR